MTKLKHLEDMDVVERRMEILVAGRLRNKGKIKDAVEKQDKLSKNSGSWSGEKEIQKWMAHRKQKICAGEISF